MPPPAPSIAENVATIQRRIAHATQAAARPGGSVHLIAVSKTYDRPAVRAAMEAGQMVFGENRVQEAAAKFDPPGVRASRLHLIGGLQTNKAADAVALADVIESLDRTSLADAIERAAARHGRLPQLLVQVNVGDEPQKSGISPAAADEFIAACQRRFGANLCGLMCVPPAQSDPAPHFRGLAALAARHGLATLSMGMSGDFEAAIACGATHVRIGSAIFGQRI